MTQPMKIARCQKCQAFVWTGLVAGIDTVVELGMRATAETIRDALVEGRSLYVDYGNRKLNYVAPQHMAAMIQEGRKCFYVTHSCCINGLVRATPLEVPPADPPRAPVTPGRPKGGRHPQPALESGSRGHTTARQSMEDYWATSPKAARHATVRPSRCIVCRGLITGSESNIVAIEHDGRIVWAYHVDH